MLLGAAVPRRDSTPETRIDDAAEDGPEGVSEAQAHAVLVAALQAAQAQQHFFGRGAAQGQRQLIAQARGIELGRGRQTARDAQRYLALQLEPRLAQVVEVLRPLDPRLQRAPALALLQGQRQLVQRQRLLRLAEQRLLEIAKAADADRVERAQLAARVLRVGEDGGAPLLGAETDRDLRLTDLLRFGATAPPGRSDPPAG